MILVVLFVAGLGIVGSGFLERNKAERKRLFVGGGLLVGYVLILWVIGKVTGVL